MNCPYIWTISYRSRSHCRSWDRVRVEHLLSTLISLVDVHFATIPFVNTIQTAKAPKVIDTSMLRRPATRLELKADVLDEYEAYLDARKQQQPEETSADHPMNSRPASVEKVAARQQQKQSIHQRIGLPMEDTASRSSASTRR